ncbi:Keratin, type I cytoskeletal 18 [Plecturocebus cupreus]
MNFTTHFTFSTNYPSLGSVQASSYGTWPVSNTASIYAGAMGSGSQISMSHSTSFHSGLGSRGLATEMAGEKKGPQIRDWVHYFKTIEDLRVQIFTNTLDNACIILQIDNVHLAGDDFRVKYETELAMRQSVESNIHGLCKVTDDSKVTQLQLKTEIDGLKKELLFMKNHKEEVKGLQTQTASSGLTIKVDAPKSQDLAKIMADMWAQYDELA